MTPWGAGRPGVTVAESHQASGQDSGVGGGRQRAMVGARVGLFGVIRSSIRRNDIRPRDRFVKTDGRYETVWVVDEIVVLPDIPPHARLSQQGDPVSGTRTISVFALRDAAFYRRLPPADGESPTL